MKNRNTVHYKVNYFKVLSNFKKIAYRKKQSNQGKDRRKKYRKQK